MKLLDNSKESYKSVDQDGNYIYNIIVITLTYIGLKLEELVKEALS